MQSTEEAYKNTFTIVGYFGKKRVHDLELISCRKAKLKREFVYCCQVETQNLSSPWSVRGGGKDEEDGGNGNDTRGLWDEFPAFPDQEGQEWVWERLWETSFVNIRGLLPDQSLSIKHFAKPDGKH